MRINGESACLADEPLFPMCTEYVGRSAALGASCPTYQEFLVQSGWLEDTYDFVNVAYVAQCLDTGTSRPLMMVSWTEPSPIGLEYDYVTVLYIHAYFDETGTMVAIRRDPRGGGTWERTCCGPEEVLTAKVVWGTMPEVDCDDAVQFGPEDALTALD